MRERRACAATAHVFRLDVLVQKQGRMHVRQAGRRLHRDAEHAPEAVVKECAVCNVRRELSAIDELRALLARGWEHTE